MDDVSELSPCSRQLVATAVFQGFSILSLLTLGAGVLCVWGWGCCPGHRRMSRSLAGSNSGPSDGDSQTYLCPSQV